MRIHTLIKKKTLGSVLCFKKECVLKKEKRKRRWKLDIYISKLIETTTLGIYLLTSKTVINTVI